MAREPHRRSGLAEVYRVGVFGATMPEGPGVYLSEHQPAAIAHLAARGTRGTLGKTARGVLRMALPFDPNKAVTGDEITVTWLAPDRWLVISDRHRPQALEEALRAALDRGGLSAAVNDVTSGRAVIRVAGTKARDLLAKGCPIDLHPGVFSKDSCAQSLMGQINVLMHAAEDGGRVDLYVARGFAASLWEFLIERAGEFGYEVLLPTGG